MLKPRILVTGATGKMVRASVRSCRCRAGLPIDQIGGDRYCIDDHKCGAFELGAPTADVLDVAGQHTEDFEAIARRYASLPPNQRTVGNCFRQFAQFVIAMLSPGVASTAMIANWAVNTRQNRSLQLSPRSGGASMPWLTQRAAL